MLQYLYKLYASKSIHIPQIASGSKKNLNVNAREFNIMKKPSKLRNLVCNKAELLTSML